MTFNHLNSSQKMKIHLQIIGSGVILPYKALTYCGISPNNTYETLTLYGTKERDRKIKSGNVTEEANFSADSKPRSTRKSKKQ